MAHTDNTAYATLSVDRSATPEPVSRLREAQDELERANRALKQARSTEAAAAKAIDAAIMANGEAYKALRLAESRVNECQKRIYELS